MIDYQKTRAWQSAAVRHSYTTKDCILYALGLGIGADPLDPKQLRFIYEKDMVVMPTMAAVLATPGFWVRDRADLGINYTKMLHGEQRVVLHQPLAPAATLIGRSRVTRIVDKGEGKGAVMHVEKVLTDEASGAAVATTEQVLFLRGDGGFSKNGGGDEAAPRPVASPASAAAPAALAVPDRAPDVVLDLPTRADAALLYRLSGDFNPLHADPAFAAQAGFPRPILHGLATYGVACHGLIKSVCDDDPTRLKSIAARLSAPVFPGETLRLEAWRVGAGEVAFRCRVLERDLLVLSHGHAVVAAV